VPGRVLQGSKSFFFPVVFFAVLAVVPGRRNAHGRRRVWRRRCDCASRWHGGGLAARRFRCSSLMKDLNLGAFPTPKSCSRSALDLPVWCVPLEPVAHLWFAKRNGQQWCRARDCLPLGKF
jgi:hypothetical protein